MAAFLFAVNEEIRWILVLLYIIQNIIFKKKSSTPTLRGEEK